jgi:hypothetical protein
VPACKSGREWFDHLGRHCSFEDPVLSHLTAEVITIEPACDHLDARSKSPVACSMPVSGSTILTGRCQLCNPLSTSSSSRAARTQVIDFWIAFSEVVISVRRLIGLGWSQYRWEGRPRRRPWPIGAST